jgi:predicted ATPase
VLVIDDLQWADSATLDLLIYLARRVADSPLLLLLSYRSEEVRSRAAIWHALAEIDRGAQPQRVELAGIAAEECAALVRTLLDLPHPAPAFEGRIYAQTQGNPFFVLETLRTLYQEGNLTRNAGGGWQTPWDEQTVDYREAAIPAQVDALIRRRLAQLAGDEHSVLDVAAVLATPFDLTLPCCVFPGFAGAVAGRGGVAGAAPFSAGDAHRLSVRARPDPPDGLRPTRSCGASGSPPARRRDPDAAPA